jgi:hypothetical protein
MAVPPDLNVTTPGVFTVAVINTEVPYVAVVAPVVNAREIVEDAWLIFTAPFVYEI